MNLYLHAIRSSATKEQLDEIDEALEPPALPVTGGRPAWWSDDDDAWAEWQTQARRAP